MHTWQQALSEEYTLPYFQDLQQAISLERLQGQVIYPPEDDVFNAFRLTEFSDVKVVILGQDPYHNDMQAHGLAFSVPEGVKPPPSLMNIYKELSEDIEGFCVPTHGCLTSWAKQGVFLLNTVLTVRANQAHSHANRGWERFTDRVIEQLNHHCHHLVFMLWGQPAQKKGSMIDRNRHLVLTAPHPSPLSAYRGFFGCHHFSQANAYLEHCGKAAIHWQL